MTRRLLVVGMVGVLAAVGLLVGRGAEATFPGENGRIAFSLDTGSSFQVHTIRPDGTGLRRLTSVAGNTSGSTWSPDGTKIVFGLDPGAPSESCRIELMRSDGGNLHDITPKVFDTRNGCAWDPSFLPSGRRIVFVAHRCENRDKCPQRVWTMSLRGRDLRSVVRSPDCCEVKRPQVSPDGRTIVVTAEKDAVVDGVRGNRKTLFTVRMNGTHLRKILPFRFDVCVCGGDWAPNGKRIVSSDQAGPTAVPGKASNLFTVRPNGSGVRFLTHSRNTDVAIAVGSYSPNGHWIVYKRITATGRYRMMKIHPSGGDPTLIATLPADFVGRAWGPRPRS